MHYPTITVYKLAEIIRPDAHRAVKVTGIALFARAGTPTCPTHGEVLEAQTVSQVLDYVLLMPTGKALASLAPVVKN